MSGIKGSRTGRTWVFSRQNLLVQARLLPAVRVCCRCGCFEDPDPAFKPPHRPLIKLSPFLHPGRIQQVLIGIRSSFWFLPVVLVFSLIVAALVLTELDRHFRTDLRQWWPSLFTTEPDGARSMLSAIASSMATVAGVVFSITIVTLALASSQYTSRVLRNFMRDRITQLVLGMFIGVYIYCLLVLRTITGEGTTFVPSVAVLLAVVLAIVSAGFFIFFIHHIATSIQAVEIARSIGLESLCTINRTFPDAAGTFDNDEDLPSDAPGPWVAIPSLEMGYIQAVQLEALCDFADAHGTIVRMDVRIGEFVAKGDPLASVAMERPADHALVLAVNRFYAIDSYRTIEQDPALGFRQLVDIALKALSPSINDTTTAIIVIDQLSVLLASCAQRRMGRSCRRVGQQTRLIIDAPEFDDMVSLSFDQILENAEGNAVVMLRLLATIDYLVPRTKDRKRLAALERQLKTLEEVAARTAKTRHAREHIAVLLEKVHVDLASAARPLRA